MYSVLSDGSGPFKSFGTPADSGERVLIFLPGYNLKPESYNYFAGEVIKNDRLPASQVVIPLFHKPRLPASIEEYLERTTNFVNGFVEGEEIDYCLGGHSFGGALSLLATPQLKKPPERVILINPAIPRNLTPAKLVLRAIRGHIDEQIYTKSRRGKVVGRVAATLYAFLTATNMRSWISGLEEIANLQLSGVNIPVDAILSGRDRIFSYDEDSRRLIESLGGEKSRAIIAPNTYHNLPLRYPRFCAELMVQLLESKNNQEKSQGIGQEKRDNYDRESDSENSAFIRRVA